MDCIIPSEMSRLILGYLKEIECHEAARVFLETCSYLQEIRDIVARGGKYSTKIGNLTLTCILDKFCAINVMMHERLNRIERCEHCDLLEQLKYIIDGSRAQKFFVNINVPSQSNQATGGSPILSSSLKRRRYSGNNDKERCKRPNRNNSFNEKQSDENISLNLDADHLDNQHKPARVNPLDVSNLPALEVPTVDSNQSKHMDSATSPLRFEDEQPSKQSTGVGTEELRNFASAEVQTFDLVESESEFVDDNPEKVDDKCNLSLLFKQEFLNNTQFPEKIAEHINKIIMPSDLSFKEISFSDMDTAGIDPALNMEISKMISSAASETQNDPMFEDFLKKIICTEDEATPNQNGDQNPDKRVSDNPTEANINQNADTLESLNPTSAKESDKMENSDKLVNSELDKFNAAAVQSIINVNNNGSNSREEVECNYDMPKENPVPKSHTPEKIKPLEVDINVPSKPVEPEVKPPEPQHQLTINPQMILSDTIPTLVICPPNNIRTYTASNFTENVSTSARFIPIAPKQSVPPLYLKTVNVPRKLPTVTDIKKVDIPYKNPRRKGSKSKPKKFEEKVVEIENPLKESDLPEEKIGETSITLYAENNTTAVIENASMPTVQLDDSISVSGTGLSPYLKFNKKTPEEEISVSAKENDENVKEEIADKNSSAIIKRTPKSILKSRSKNHRLSMSTPRRRSSHIRALNFGTPVKELNTSRRMSMSESPANFTAKGSKSACRASLFRSPMAGSSQGTRKVKSPGKMLTSVPIATRSPAPKLKGGWDKVSGVEMIIGDSSNVSLSPKMKLKKGLMKGQSGEMKSWDSDLRQSINIEPEPAAKAKSKGGKSTGDVDKKVKKTINQKEVEDANKEDSSMSKSQSNFPESTDKSPEVTDIKSVIKKYAKLKTLSTSVSKDPKTVEKSGLFSELSLETPRKPGLFDIPPTPRVLSPSSATTPFIQTSEETKVQCFIKTPDYPPTPSINVTPKNSAEKPADGMKEDFSSYYQPRNEKVVEIISVEHKVEENVLLSKETLEINKLEITQFEVIKENLPKDDATKDLIISSKDSLKEDQKFSPDNYRHADTSGSTEDSSDSSSSSNSSSNSCGSSCSGCNNDSTNTLSHLSAKKRSFTLLTEVVPIEHSVPKAVESVPNEEIKEQSKPVEETVKNEASPVKVFPLDVQNDDMNLETPAKDEVAELEAGISETPCISKGIENPSKFSSKMFALISENSKVEIPKVPLVNLKDLNESHTKTRMTLVNETNAQSYKEEMNQKLLRTKQKLLGMKSAVKPATRVRRKPVVKPDVPNVKAEVKQTPGVRKSTRRAAQKQPTPARKPPKKQLPKKAKIEEAVIDLPVVIDDEIEENLKKLGEGSDMIIDMTKQSDKSADELELEKEETYKDDVRKILDDSKVEEPEKTEQNVDVPLRVSKAKVDNVKRDLFSNDEDDEKDQIEQPESPKQELLESLQLVPANKSDVEKKPENRNHLELSFVYDDSLPKRKFKRTNLEPDYSVKISVGDPGEISLTLTPMELLFSMSPVKNVKSKGKAEAKGSKGKLKIDSQPLATSSPLLLDQVPKISDKRKANDKLKKSEPKSSKETEKKSGSRKRKELPEVASEPMKKKSNLISENLQNRLKIDKLLMDLHGPKK